MTFNSFSKTIIKRPRGKAAGPFADISDIICSLVAHCDYYNTKHTLTPTQFLKSQTQYIKLNSHHIFLKTFNSSFLFVLYKSPEDLSTLRPVAVGGKWRRALTSTIVRQNNSLFAGYLTPYKFAIGLKSGTNFIYHTKKSILAVSMPSLKTKR